MDNFIKTYRYVKGVYEMKVFSPATRDLLYYDNKITDSNFASSVNMGELMAGVGNPTVIQLPDTAKINVTMTAQDVDLRSRQLQTGGLLSWNGTTDTCEIVVATSATLSTSVTPVAPYGSSVVCAYVNGSGEAYTVNPVDNTITGFTAVVGETYQLRYYIQKPTNEQLNVYTLFSPEIVTLEVKMPVFAAPSASAANTGTLVGYWHYIIPRYQFNGDITTTVNQTTAGTSVLSGQALAYDVSSTTACVAGNLSSLAYLVYEPLEDTGLVQGMFVVGGEIALEVGKTLVAPIKLLMADGGSAQPDYTALTYATGSGGTATFSVSNTGVLTAVAEGDDQLKVTLTATPEITCVADVSVTAP